MKKYIKKNIKKIIVLIVIFAMVLTTLLSSAYIAFGKTKDKKKEEKEDTRTVEEQLEGTGMLDQLSEIEQKKQDAYDKLQKITEKVEKTQKELDDYNESVKEKTAEIKKLKKELSKTNRELEERKEGLDQRLRFMYENRVTGYLDILLSSKGIMEFMDNIDVITKIYKHDQDTFDILKEKKENLEEKKKKLEYINKILKNKKKEIDRKEEEQKKNQAFLQEGFDQIRADEEAILREIEDIVGTGEFVLGDEIISLAGKYKGGMICPVSNYVVTGEYMEQRSYEKHPGIDLACSQGSPVRAAAAGIVIKSEWYGGYGKCVVISHGSGLTTLYGHNSVLNCKAGDKVRKGEIIALVGSTGWSTGPHCHFEVHKNGQLQNPRNYVKIKGHK